MRKIYSLFAFAFLFASCGESHVKKVLIYANNKASFNQDAKAISLTGDTTGYEHAAFEYLGSEPVQIKVVKGDDLKTVDIPDDGYYIVNFKKDTIIGSYIPFNDIAKVNSTISQDELKHTIDSIQQLMMGKNIGGANKTYFIVPGATEKITSNANAIVVEPYHKVTALEVKEGEKPEVYKFYTMNELREKVERMISLTK